MAVSLIQAASAVSLIQAASGTFGLPALFSPTPEAGKRTLEFFTANIRNPNTRTAYARAAAEFSTWCEEVGLRELRAIEPVHVATYIETLQRRLSAPSVKLHLAGLRMLFDWLVIGQVIAANPASSVRGPKHSVKKGKAPVLGADEARALLDGIDTSKAVGLRDRALIALMVYTFARVGATVGMKVQDVYVQGRRTWVRLHEKGGKQHEMPCHHNLDEYLHAYIEGAQIGSEGRGVLFRTAAGRTGQLTERAMSTHRARDEPGGRVPDDPAARRSHCSTDGNRLSQLPGYRHHRVPAQWRQAGGGAADGQP